VSATGTAARCVSKLATGEEDAPGGQACGEHGDTTFGVRPDLGLGYQVWATALTQGVALGDIGVSE